MHLFNFSRDDDVMTVMLTDSEAMLRGCTVFAHPQLATQTSDFFGGCLRSLRINGHLVDWHALHHLVDVHVSGCPQADDDHVYA